MIRPKIPRIVTCREVQDEGLDALYLAGRLNPVETLAFEQHCFRCSICWSLVTHGAAIRAATLGARTDIPARTAVARAMGRTPSPWSPSPGGGSAGKRA
jgi:hypothetical protein